MIKLATPIQYEESLDELNQLRPMTFLDEGKRTLDIPVVNVNPVNVNRPALGKLLRCNQFGGLIGNSALGYSNVEQELAVLGAIVYDAHITFSQKVFAVVILAEVTLGIPYSIWTDPTYTLTFKYIAVSGTTFLPFVGTDLYFTNSVGGSQHRLNIYGLY